ncbi:adenosylcobinamide-GDP ribazoletransferase [uncultured Methylibium sp.]|uniref:adenosylcobinamide-GDP ribazoletransferase n=1 Tax=uncultured Methylibium sp. TaxID=381093 RepID=UPI0025FE7E50|nr:adenosylcobinamide-GDP ribazoletransferase [uncultured Methylibium sp.]
MKFLAHELRLLLLALQFLTRVPVRGRLAAWVGWQPEWLNQSARYLPLVGAFVGAVGAVVLMTAAQWWPMPVAVGLSIAATLWLTGAFHEDGLADTLDGLGGSADRERALAIMKDSRIGSYGTLALIVVLGLKATALASLPLGWAAATLLVAHTLSRAVAVTLIRVLPYAGDVEHAKAKPLATRVSAASWCVACAWPLALVALLIGARRGDVAYALPGAAAWLVALAAAVTAGAFCARWFHRRLGGVTGDTLGAAQQLSELAVYLAVLAMLGQ